VVRLHGDLSPLSTYASWCDFDVLLTMRLSIFILVINQLDAQNFCFTISFISCLYMFQAPRATPIGVMIPEAV